MCFLYFFSYLHISGDTYGRPIHGQKEVSAYSAPNSHNQWMAAEGIFIKPTEPTFATEHTHDEF